MGWPAAIEPGKTGRERSTERPEKALQSFHPEHISIDGVSGKCLVPALSGYKHLYKIFRQPGYVIQGNRLRFANRFFHVPGKARQEISKLLRADGHFMVFGSVAAGCQPCKGPLIRQPRSVETKRKTTQMVGGLAHSHTKHRGRINSAAQQESHRHI